MRGGEPSTVLVSPSPPPSSFARGDAVSLAMNDFSNDDNGTYVPVLPEDSTPLVWVEAEHIFVARGYIYRVHGRCGPLEDSETVLDHQVPDTFTVLSTRSPAQLAASAPSGWGPIEPAHDLDIGARLGDTLVAKRHGGNEYTVVHPTASILEDPPR
jgi:hypothetical protein